VFASAGIRVQQAANPFPALSVAGGGSARMRFEDIVITNVADPDGPPNVSVSLFLDLSGAFSLSQVGDSNATAAGAVTVGYGLGKPGQNLFGQGIFQTPAFRVPVNTPLLLTVILTASANAVTCDGAPVSATTSFDHTLRFPIGSPVFNLPEDYTANSQQANIANNLSALPAPPTLWLFAAGLALIAARRPRPAR